MIRSSTIVVEEVIKSMTMNSTTITNDYFDNRNCNLAKLQGRKHKTRLPRSRPTTSAQAYVEKVSNVSTRQADVAKKKVVISTFYIQCKPIKVFLDYIASYFFFYASRIEV